MVLHTFIMGLLNVTRNIGTTLCFLAGEIGVLFGAHGLINERTQEQTQKHKDSKYYRFFSF